MYRCVSVCCFKVPGSLGNNWCKSSINFTDRGALCASFTSWAPVCCVTIHSPCTIATKYHSFWVAFHWFCFKVKIYAGGVVVLNNCVILYSWEFTKAFPCFFFFLFFQGAHTVCDLVWNRVNQIFAIHRDEELWAASVTQMRWMQQTSLFSATADHRFSTDASQSILRSTGKTHSAHHFCAAFLNLTPSDVELSTTYINKP